MKNILKYLLLSVTIALINTNAYGETAQSNYQVGGYSMLINGSMNLSKIDSSFDDLSANGIDGPHHSSLYLLRSMNDHFAIGVATLVGDSENKSGTTMGFQGIGFMLDAKYGSKYFFKGGLHIGSAIVNVMSHTSGSASITGVNSGTHYKDSGVFIAPYVGVGWDLELLELSFIIKQVDFVLSDKNNNIDAFNAMYSGIGFGVKF